VSNITVRHRLKLGTFMQKVRSIRLSFGSATATTASPALFLTKEWKSVSIKSAVERKFARIIRARLHHPALARLSTAAAPGMMHLGVNEFGSHSSSSGSSSRPSNLAWMVAMMSAVSAFWCRIRFLFLNKNSVSGAQFFQLWRIRRFSAWIQEIENATYKLNISVVCTNQTIAQKSIPVPRAAGISDAPASGHGRW